MTTEQKQVLEFVVKAGQKAEPKPVIPSREAFDLRMNLLTEELNELQYAHIDNNLVEIVDALGDLLYVLLGTSIACGIDLEPIFQEIHRSNMSKFIDGHRREDGKWIKGPSYSPANLAPIIEAQIKGV